MTRRVGAMLLMLVLLCALGACGHRDPEDRLEAPFEAAENALEAAVDRALSGAAGDIGAEQAKAAALAQAGLTAEEVTGLRADYELEGGVPQYDVSFRQGFWEWDVDIHAETGAVLRWERDD